MAECVSSLFLSIPRNLTQQYVKFINTLIYRNRRVYGKFLPTSYLILPASYLLILRLISKGLYKVALVTVIKRFIESNGITQKDWLVEKLHF